MDISQLIRSFFSAPAKNEQNVLELKAGQIVKGIVLKLLGDQEAIINIAGVRTKAKLEVPLQPGEITNLQVQSGSDSNQLVLKPVTMPSVAVTPSSAGEILNSLGIQETKDLKLMVSKMTQFQLPLTKENILQFQRIAETRPPTVSLEQWLESVMTASIKNLPLSTESALSLQQVLFGPKLHQLIKSLEIELAAFDKNTASRLANIKTAPIPIKPDIVNRADHVESALPISESNSSMSDELPLHQLVTRVRETIKQLQQIGELSMDKEVTSPSHDPEQEYRPQLIPDKIKSLPQEEALSLNQPRAADAENKSSKIMPIKSDNTVDNQDDHSLETSLADSSNRKSTAASQAPSWVVQVTRLLGLEHESHLLKRLLAVEMDQGADFQTGTTSMDSLQSITSGLQHETENLKSRLLQLMKHDLPLPLKEISQQLIHHITGQQLMLADDRQSQFSHVTLFLPITNGNGEQTASVHIQSRRGQKGQLDAQNCHLLFDLQLASLGEMLIDVNVLDRMVNIQVHNDHPLIHTLIDQSKAEIYDAVESLGYRCLNVQSKSFAQMPLHQTEHKETGGAAAVSPSAYRPYKGVDIRI